MMKVIFNNDNEHVLSVNQINYNTTFQVNNYSNRSDGLNIQLNINSIGAIATFENVALITMQILNNNDEEISTINFPEHFYMLASTANFYEGSNNININFGTVNNE